MLFTWKLEPHYFAILFIFLYAARATITITMTMPIEGSETASPPQAASLRSDGDLEILVRGLVEQRCAEFVEQAKALGSKAKAAEKSCANLAERVALLEDQPDASLESRLESNSLEGPTTENGSFARTTESNDEDGRLTAVVGVQEDMVEEGLATRVDLIERRLKTEEKEPPDESKYSLPESTFSLLVTHHPLSIPFAFAVFSTALTISCLSLTLASSIQNSGGKENPLGIPAGVGGMVVAAQFLGERIHPFANLTHHVTNCVLCFFANEK